jgi:hypothetical protein
MASAITRITGYPICGECKTPYILRRTYVLAFKKGERSSNRWLWQRDCKHKKAAPVVVEEKKGKAGHG